MNQFLLLVVSLSAVTAAILLKRSGNRLEILLGSLAVFILGIETSFFFVANWFTGQGVDESVIFHIKHGVKGAGFDEYLGLIAWSIFGILFSLISAYLTAWKLRRHKNSSQNIPGAVFLAILCFSILFHPVTIGFLWSQSSPLRQIFSTEREDFADFYRNPNLTGIGNDSKNLVMVFMESYERSYFDESVFPGLVKSLKALERQGVSFTQIESLPGTAWTIGGLTASLCGLPLFTTSHGNSMTGMDTFLPSATCVGDLLAKDGMHLTYLSGSSVEFAGTEKFFESHGFDRVIGLEKLRDQVSFVPGGWGIPDDVLFDHAYSEIKKSNRNGEPFGMFISTMDTHPPGGRLSDSCLRRSYAEGDNEILNSLACSDEIITRFVKRILSGPMAKNTVVVLASDHLSMANTASHLLDKTDRKNFFVILNAGHEGITIDRKGSQLDIGPTVLSAMGYEADLALGRNLLSGEASVSELIPDLPTEIGGWYKSITQFWGFPRLGREDRVVVNPDKGIVRVADAEFQYPLLMEIDRDGETTIRFDSEHDEYRLFDFVTNMNPRVAFFWMDYCNSINQLVEAPTQGLCLLYGYTASASLVLEQVTSQTTLSQDSMNQSLSLLNQPRQPNETAIHAVDRDRIIAHAGGMIDGHTYTNTLDALNQNYAAGFQLFELDISETADGHFVAAHDWKFWQQLTGFKGELPPSLSEFNNTLILEKYTPLDMSGINEWFEKHPDAVLVTDKINDPQNFANQFIDRTRLIMELFTISAVEEGIKAGIRSAMPSENVLRELGSEATKYLQRIGVKDVALSRRLINTNGALLNSLRNAGIRAYIFQLNRFKSRDEAFALCSDLDFVYGFYADQYDFNDPPSCENVIGNSP